MKKLEDTAEFDWISKSLWQLGSREDGGEGHTLRHLFPDVFETYFKILHPIFRDESIDDESRTWSQDDEFDESNLVRVRWKDLAAQLDVPYHRQINEYAFSEAFGGRWPRYLVGAEEGTLEPSILTQLSETLVKYTSARQWFFEYFVVATKDIKEDEVYAGDLTDLPTANEQACCGAGPTYWWPSDRAWAVCTDYDLTFTIVGSTTKAAEAIAQIVDVEGFEMHITDRIDYKSHAERDGFYPVTTDG